MSLPDICIFYGNDFSTAGRILIDWNGRLSPSNIKEAFNLIGTLLVPHRPTHPSLFHSPAPFLGRSAAAPRACAPSTPALPQAPTRPLRRPSPRRHRRSSPPLPRSSAGRTAPPTSPRSTSPRLRPAWLRRPQALLPRLLPLARRRGRLPPLPPRLAFEAQALLL